jgi:glucose-6-phosphate 1-dehydrogenase
MPQALQPADRPGDPCAIVIFGASGDLTRRKLIPALLNLDANGLLGKNVTVVGVARREMSDEQFAAQLFEDAQKVAPGAVSPEAWQTFKGRLRYVAGDFSERGTHEKLKVVLDDVASTRGTGGNVLFYLATPPDAFASIVEQLGAVGLAAEQGTAWRRVVIEKPFGRDLDSAVALDAKIHSVLRERQVYRIDHYLGKETVQNILVFRFANGIFEPIWNRRYIDHVQVMVAENIGIEGRGAYYETAGALRDMVQNHMLQLLALVAMEPPVSLAADRMRDERVKVLEAIRPLTPEQVLESTVRGQYGEGFVGGERVAGYRQEQGVAENSSVETYAAMKLFVENWRWAGVPFYLRTGKRLPLRNTEIIIQFRRPPLLFFPETAAGQVEANRLVMHIQPDEGITLEIKAKRPAPTLKLDTVRLDFSYADFGPTPAATGYERLLYDAMVGDSTLFHRSDMVDAAWRVVTPLIDVWASLKPRDFPNYAAGSWGPAAADALLERDGREWYSSKE